MLYFVRIQKVCFFPIYIKSMLYLLRMKKVIYIVRKLKQVCFLNV